MIVVNVESISKDEQLQDYLDQAGIDWVLHACAQMALRLANGGNVLEERARHRSNEPLVDRVKRFLSESKVPLTRLQLASLCNVAPNSLNQSISDMNKEGILQWSQGGKKNERAYSIKAVL